MTFSLQAHILCHFVFLQGHKLLDKDPTLWPYLTPVFSLQALSPNSHIEVRSLISLRHLSQIKHPVLLWLGRNLWLVLANWSWFCATILTLRVKLSNTLFPCHSDLILSWDEVSQDFMRQPSQLDLYMEENYPVVTQNCSRFCRHNI